jgi:hypothetical protein
MLLEVATVVGFKVTVVVSVLCLLRLPVFGLSVG